jgi:hypothetical protein
MSSEHASPHYWKSAVVQMPPNDRTSPVGGGLARNTVNAAEALGVKNTLAHQPHTGSEQPLDIASMRLVVAIIDAVEAGVPIPPRRPHLRLVK